jgi:hypothetical protein
VRGQEFVNWEEKAGDARRHGSKQEQSSLAIETLGGQKAERNHKSGKNADQAQHDVEESKGGHSREHDASFALQR